MQAFNIKVNGSRYRIDADPAMPLLWALRDRLNLTGTKYGCGAGLCGACTVHQNGRAVRSCQITMAQADGKSFITIEGLSTKGTHPCQRAWLEEDVAQCGFCQPGMIMEAAALLRAHPSVSDAEIGQALDSHICRCGTYTKIRAAVHRAASAR
ncbi:MAG: molybdenum-dependent oxidoreductase iron-sulfur binding subunit [Bryobacterales bacterium]|nr:molybdenum-dependent oxidoreductase iron-sulfur binding subunit [Bryobacterales bacterium]